MGGINSDQGITVEGDPLFAASAAAGVINTGPGTNFLSDDGTYKVPTAAPSGLSANLAVDNTTGANNIVITSGQSLTSSSGASALNLRPFGTDNNVVLATDGLAYGEVGVEMYPDFLGVWGAAYSQFLAFNNTVANKYVELANTLSGEGISLRVNSVGGSAEAGDLIVFDNDSAARTSTSGNKNPISASTKSTEFGTGVVNSGAGGTDGAKVLMSNAWYVDNLAFYHLDGASDRKGVLTNPALTGDRTWTFLDRSYTLADDADVALNTTHRTSNGSDHSFINQDVTTTGTPTFGGVTTGSASFVGNILFDNNITPPQITSNQNDYSPTGLADCNTMNLDSDANRDITGLLAPTSGDQIIFVTNEGASSIKLKNNDGSSIAANRFLLKADLTIETNESIILRYDSTNSRWRADNI